MPRVRVSVVSFLGNGFIVGFLFKMGHVIAVALSYSAQILDEGVIPITPHDVLVDALVSPAGVIPISPTALDRYDQVNLPLGVLFFTFFGCELRFI